MIKILFVIDSLNSGGAEKSLVNLLNELDPSKYQIDLQLFSTRNFFLPLLPNNVNLLPLPLYFQKCNLSIRDLICHFEVKFLFARLSTSLLMRIRSKKKNHILQIQWESIRRYIDSNPQEYDIAIAYSQGIPTYYVHEKVNCSKKYAWINCLYSKTRYNKQKDHHYYNHFKKIILVSKRSRDDFLTIFPDFRNKSMVIYDFISKKIIESLGNEAFTWNDDFHGIRIASILRFEWVKGPDIILECCRKLISVGIPFKWYLIGNGGSMFKDIVEGIKKYNLQEILILLGPQINPFKFIQNSDIYVQSSRIEGYCMALAEAKMLDVGIVSTNFLLAKEHIEDGVDGYICEATSESMFQKIILMIKNERFRIESVQKRENKYRNCNQELNKFFDLIHNS